MKVILRLSEAGRYRLEANEDDREVSSSTEFQVSDIRQELLDTDMRPDHLQRIAELTGGAVIGIRRTSSTHFPDQKRSD
jgi:hypothetical protein